METTQILLIAVRASVHQNFWLHSEATKKHSLAELRQICHKAVLNTLLVPAGKVIKVACNVAAALYCIDLSKSEQSK